MRPALAPRALPVPYRRGAATAGATRLDSNEGALAAPALLERVARSLGDEPARFLRDYPSVDRLRQRLAQRLAVDPSRVAVTAGADGALDRLFRAYLERGDEVLIAEPTFEMFPRFAALAGATLRGAPWRDAFPATDLVALAGPRTRLAVVVSPNNPTGAVITGGELERLARSLPDTLVILDHVYVEYAAVDLTELALQLPNVVVVRTFSKARGLAACRVGWAIGPPAVVEAIETAGEPYPVAAISLEIAEASLVDDTAMRAHIETIRRHRAALRDTLLRLGVPTPDSHANFVYLELDARADSARAGLATHGFAVRAFPGALRITVPEESGVLARLLDALARVLTPGGSS